MMMSDLLARVLEAEKIEEEHDRLVEVWTIVDGALCQSRDYAGVDALLGAVDCTQLSVDTLFALATISVKAKKKLPSREDFVDRFHAHLIAKGLQEEAKELLWMDTIFAGTR